MIKEFTLCKYDAGAHIINEGERGLKFYIIVSGITEVLKAGIGCVASLGPGRSFGEVALQGNDLRTATVACKTPVEVLSLHKVDYDHFVRDIQLAETREHGNLLKEVKMFKVPSHM
jgi:CRP-like cAMP-binding protein